MSSFLEASQTRFTLCRVGKVIAAVRCHKDTKYLSFCRNTNRQMLLLIRLHFCSTLVTVPSLIVDTFLHGDILLRTTLYSNAVVRKYTLASRRARGSSSHLTNKGLRRRNMSCVRGAYASKLDAEANFRNISDSTLKYVLTPYLSTVIHISWATESRLDSCG